MSKTIERRLVALEDKQFKKGTINDLSKAELELSLALVSIALYFPSENSLERLRSIALNPRETIEQSKVDHESLAALQGHEVHIMKPVEHSKYLFVETDQALLGVIANLKNKLPAYQITRRQCAIMLNVERAA